MSDRGGLDIHAHTAGSQSYDEIRERIRREEGVDPSMLHILQETHRRSDGTYIDKRAQIIVEELQKQLESMPQAADESTEDWTPSISLTPEVEDELYKKHVEPNKGRVFGLGGHLVWKAHGESSSQASDIPEPNPTPLMEDVAQINNQLNIVLNFIKKFMPDHSLEDFTNQRGTNLTDPSVARPSSAISGSHLSASLDAVTALHNLRGEQIGDNQNDPMDEDGVAGGEEDGDNNCYNDNA